MLPLVRWRASAAADGLVAFASTPPETVLGHPARHCSLFQHLSEQDWRTILEAARVRSAAKGSLYFRQGEPATAVYILIRGQVKLVRLAPDGRQVFVRLVVPGEPFGLAAVLAETPQQICASVTQDGEALAWDATTMLQIITKHPEVALNSLRFIAKGLQANRDRLGDLAAGHVERRVARALLRLARAPAPRLGGAVTAVGLPHQDLADYAGTNIYSVSRILGRWRRFGIIETGRAWVGILDTGWLTSIADGSLPPYLQASLTPRSKYRFASTCAQSRRFPKRASTR